ncbi:myotubularin-related protein 3 isoform X3 [Erinaceus europaeus]|uniref:phosphatidylinositol-3,5-bisphosphate 3-phosphatase n=1 Tax=Erinaceus europaeus TaxID=9365 RepID=A0ABM3XJ19_ERIEU|nr:myotubularin-related protein 3 isoform X3 [Erinaceus europaeus]XP_060048827.1 myotubularin-related protein 3 isoform X3 [Erinaceus europaeus]XP_060048828.1 myotubularin-related protein 3 isoform X3 [Erinaceus europaeus]
MDEESPHNLECIQANRIFPRKQLVREDETLQVPFLELHGESTEYVGRAEDAVIALSNYRLHIKFKESLVNVPLQLIESVECRDIFQLHLTCKDCKVIRCQFSTFEQCQEWLKRLNSAIRPPTRIEDLFSFAYHAWCLEVYASEKEQHGDLCRPGEHVSSRFKNEVERMGFDMNNAWRISNINEKYRLCGSYPQELIVPAWITDKELESVAGFRSWKRLPAVVYRHQSNGAVIARCGQPEVSWWGWRNADDEHLVQSVAKACACDSQSSGSKPPTRSSTRDFANTGDLSDAEFDSSLSNASGTESLAIQPQKLLILDARSYAAAVANRAKGGGCECPEYYPNCEVVFMGMANIHSIRRSFQSLRLLCTQMPDPGNWLSALEGTKWLHHLSVLLKSALLAVHAVDRDQRPVLVHCSDGWDRTPQIVALAKLLLDPYYRTIEGFQVLVETEWLDFGHKFADRCGHGESAGDLSERCPVFLQWLDCVHQLQRQFPCSFAFNEAFLVKLVQHTYSCLFGTFLCNNAKERGERHTRERTCSVWSLLRAGNKAFGNLLYSSQSEAVLYPVCHVRNLMLWSAVYLPCPSPSTPVDESCAPYPAPATAPDDPPLSRLPKTRSFDNLPVVCDNTVPLASRRCSDPSLNEKWQEQRRSLELSSLACAGEEPPGADGLGRPARLPGSAELSVAAGVTEGQMENILQEATKEESGLEEPAHGRGSEVRVPERREETQSEQERWGETPEGSAIASHREPGPDTAVPRSLPSPGLALALASQGLPEQQGGLGRHSASPQEPCRGEGGRAVPEEPPGDGGEALLPALLDAKADCGASAPSSLPPSQAPAETRGPSTGSPVGTLAENKGEPEGEPRDHHRPSLVSSGRFGGRDRLPEVTEPKPLERSPAERPQAGCVVHRTPPGGGHGPTPAPCAVPSSGCKEGPVCNGIPEMENKVSEKPPAPGETVGSKDTLGHQLPATSCGSVPGHARSAQHKWRPSAACSHLDDDGMPVYTDTIQQRLRQIESGHQQEVETLKKQVQELRSRLESQYLASSLRFNGDFGDEVTSVPDSESSVDQNCLSRCSTELFSEASWEQVDKQDTEMTRWLPDHLAAHCYACDSAFWLASRKHHCRGTGRVDQTWNCGNVFCSSCCNQKVPVPSQQLFEPSRVCKSCYSSLRPTSSSIDLELDKPIAATSN